MSREDKDISYLWFGGKDGWQVTSFHPSEDPAIGFPRNGDVRLYVSEEAYDSLSKENSNLKQALDIQRKVADAINDNGQQAFLLQQQNQKLRELLSAAVKALEISECRSKIKEVQDMVGSDPWLSVQIDTLNIIRETLKG